MILYVNGDSHAAAAEAVNSHAWAIDDGQYWDRGQEPHPDNDAVSFGRVLATALGCDYFNQSQAGGSNARIIRTTREWLQQQHNLQDVFVLIQWSTWERQEWFWNGQWLQVNASGTDHVPAELQQQYREFVVNVDWPIAESRAHQTIHAFHKELLQNGVRHLMFNGNNHFRLVNPLDWGTNYLAPYYPNQTFDAVLRQNGFKTVSPKSWHFGPDAHCFWAQYLLQYINRHNLLDSNEIPAD